MEDCTGVMQTFGALPEAQALQADPRPAWIWSSDGARILWANAAGARRLGARCLEDLGQRRYPDSHPLRHDVQNAARIAGPDGVAAAGLRIVPQPRAAPVACEIRRIAVPHDHDGILVVAQGSSEAASARSDEGPEPSPGIDNVGPVRSPIPEWLRARLATYPPSARQGAAGRAGEGAASQKPCAAGTTPIENGSARARGAAGLSVEEQSAFQEIALALGSTIGLGARPTRPPQPPADDDPGSADEAGSRLSPASQPGDIPSAFCGQAASPPSLHEEDVARRLDGSEARLREVASILDIATDGVVVLDGDGRIESLNGSAEALFGVSHAEVAGQPFADLLAPDSRTVAMGYFADVKADGLAGLINGGRELEGQVEGGTLPLFVTFGRIGVGEAGARFCAVLRDLTQWKQAEAELVAARRRAEEASSQKSDFLARVSHEIRTPLNGIIGFADVIVGERFGPLENPRYREYVRDIRSSGEHVLSLVNDLLDIAKIEAGKLELNFATVQLNQLVRECVILMQPAASGARIILRTSLAGDLPAVRADARTIRQVVLNILSNAVKFTGPAGQVIVSTGRAEGGVVLRVRDTGDGMSEAELVKALEPFRQLRTAPLGDRTGTGLGLPLTKALVEANRASFAISSAKGEGTIVKVGFPSACLVADRF